MFSLTYSRKSVCMGDDAGCGEYTLSLPDGATLDELMKVLLRGGCGNDWPIPYTGANSIWVIQSNAGRLGTIRTDGAGLWHIQCEAYPADTPLGSLGITRVYCDRDDEDEEEQTPQPAEGQRTGKRPDDAVVWRDGHFTLGRKDGRPYLRAGGTTWFLSCHPYEPCLYITGADGSLTVVHNAFDPSDVLEDFLHHETILSITGRKYGPRDFCEMVEYAAGMGDISISDAERLFRLREKETRAEPETAPSPVTEKAAPTPAPEKPKPEATAPPLPTARPFSPLYTDFPDAEADIYFVRDDEPCRGLASHRRALAAACRLLALSSIGNEAWRFDPDAARGRPVSADAPFLPAPEGTVSLRKAILDPPHGNSYGDADFDRLCAALFPSGRSRLEVFAWSTDFSDYFDEGHEWWGAMCYTVYDRAMDRYAVLLASATD